MTRCARYAFGLPKSKWNSTVTAIPPSPGFAERPHVEFMRPGIARLLVQLPVRLADRGRVHQRPFVAGCAAGTHPLTHPGGIHPGVDHQVGDVDALWP